MSIQWQRGCSTFHTIQKSLKYGLTPDHGAVDDMWVRLVEVEVVVVADGGDVGAGGSSVVDLGGVAVTISDHVAKLLGVAAQDVVDLAPGPAAVPPGLCQARLCMRPTACHGHPGGCVDAVLSLAEDRLFDCVAELH